MIKEYLGKDVRIEIDRPLGSLHPKHEFLYELNYGFVPGTISGDGEEIDAYVIGVGQPTLEFEGKCVAIVHRLDDDDDKLVLVPEGKEDISDEEIVRVTHFQEQYFKIEIWR